MSVYLTAAELKTNVDPDVVNLITKADPTITDSAIMAAIGEAKGYLSRYDLDKLFGVEADATAPIVTDDFLKQCVKNIAIYRLVARSNANYSMEKIVTYYEDAIRSLMRIQDGRMAPNWPYKDTSAVTYPDGQSVFASYNEKQTNRI